MKSAPVTVVPGIRASLRTDAELVTCQVHDPDTRPPPEPSHPSSPVRRLHLRPSLRPPSEVTRLLQVEGERALPLQKSPGAGAHLLARSGGEHDGFDARDVGG